MGIKYNGFEFYSGSRVRCRIQNIELFDAMIYIREEDIDRWNAGSDKCALWICHNEQLLSGSESPEKFNYLYSWKFYIRNYISELSDDVSDLLPIDVNCDIKVNSVIDPDIVNFIKANNIDSQIFNLFNFKFGLFDEYDKYDISKNEGFITLVGRKSTEIKFARFIRQMTNKWNQTCEKSKAFKKILISDKELESIHNKFVAYQKEERIKVEFLSGQDILEGYKTLNYYSKGGTIGKSCMGDKLEFLKIYTENPNQVELAVIKNDNKISARCLIWTDINGNKYSDRVYYCQDWMENFVCDRLKIMGIDPIKNQKIKIVKLDKWKFDTYPYVDSFYNFDNDNGLLLFINPQNKVVLRNTDGRL